MCNSFERVRLWSRMFVADLRRVAIPVSGVWNRLDKEAVWRELTHWKSPVFVCHCQSFWPKIWTCQNEQKGSWRNVCAELFQRIVIGHEAVHVGLTWYCTRMFLKSFGAVRFRFYVRRFLPVTKFLTLSGISVVLELLSALKHLPYIKFWPRICQCPQSLVVQVLYRNVFERVRRVRKKLLCDRSYPVDGRMLRSTSDVHVVTGCLGLKLSA